MTAWTQAHSWKLSWNLLNFQRPCIMRRKGTKQQGWSASPNRAALAFYDSFVSVMSVLEDLPPPITITNTFTSKEQVARALLCTFCPGLLSFSSIFVGSTEYFWYEPQAVRAMQAPSGRVENMTAWVSAIWEYQRAIIMWIALHLKTKVGGLHESKTHRQAPRGEHPPQRIISYGI